ncbi:hypothetical protein GCM10007269_02090 [Microbacterium murale]|uniref:Uncharacterized protein n=1 Tax=Microbacterium murale TaxID=1081040 RepID=A0ABQ1RBJ3_9MICO|nr:hypothetical protein GCM10007269_02090 [Microbacterium murale]
MAGRSAGISVGTRLSLAAEIGAIGNVPETGRTFSCDERAFAVHPTHPDPINMELRSIYEGPRTPSHLRESHPQKEQ